MPANVSTSIIWNGQGPVHHGTHSAALYLPGLKAGVSREF